MADSTGIWHRTTLQTAQAPQTYHTTTLTGHKRSHGELQAQEAEVAVRPSPRPRISYAPHDAPPPLPRLPPRLKPSVVRPVDGHNVGGPGEYTQRGEIAATPTSTADPLLSLSHRIYGLPPQLVENLASLGVRTIYPWQKQCLLGPGLLEGEKNIVYSAPTGAGKSLVADVLMLKRVIQNKQGKALLVLPFVALVQEKARWLRNVVRGITRAETNPDQAHQEPRLWRKRADADTIRVVAFFGGSKLRASVCILSPLLPPLGVSGVNTDCPDALVAGL